MKKLTKSQVIALAKKGLKKVELYPSNVAPNSSMWVKGYQVDIIWIVDELFYINPFDDIFKPFNEIVDYFQYYNCCRELGMRVHFYIEVGEK